MRMVDCLFCKIADKEIDAEIVREDRDTVSILDIHPRAPGHAMVIPKKHSETILDLDNAEIERVFAAVRDTIELIRKAFRPDGFTVGINQGKASGQAIDHLHIHVIPRFRDDKGGSIHSVVDNEPTEEVKDIGRKIRGEQRKK